MSDRAGQVWVWHGSFDHDRIFLVLSPKTPTTHNVLDLETGQLTHVWERWLAEYKTWRRVA